MTKIIYEYPYLDNTAELDYNTLEIKNELPTELTDSWKTILHDKVNNKLFSFQQGACPGVLQRINPPSNLDLIEYNLENGEIYKYITTDSAFECSYERSMAITSDGNFIIITNSPDNSVSIIDLSTSGTEEIAHTTNVNLFPNPCTNFIHVSIKHAVTNDFSVEIYNRTGQMIRNLQKNRYETNFKVDVNNYPAGQYYIRIFNSAFCYTHKFQKI